MHQELRYQLVPHAAMLTGLVSIVLTHRRLIVALDSAYIAPELAPVLEELGAGIMQPRTRLATPQLSPQTAVRIQPATDIDDMLAVAEVRAGTIDVLVNKELIRPELAAELGRHGTHIMRYFT